MKDMKACPFCGSQKLIYVRDPEDCAEIRGIYCLGCKVLVKWNIEAKKTDTFGETENQWAEKWNARSPEQEFLDGENKHKCPRCGHEWTDGDPGEGNI